MLFLQRIPSEVWTIRGGGHNRKVVPRSHEVCRSCVSPHSQRLRIAAKLKNCPYLPMKGPKPTVGRRDYSLRDVLLCRNHSSTRFSRNRRSYRHPCIFARPQPILPTWTGDTHVRSHLHKCDFAPWYLARRDLLANCSSCVGLDGPRHLPSRVRMDSASLQRGVATRYFAAAMLEVCLRSWLFGRCRPHAIRVGFRQHRLPECLILLIIRSTSSMTFPALPCTSNSTAAPHPTRGLSLQCYVKYRKAWATGAPLGHTEVPYCVHMKKPDYAARHSAPQYCGSPNGAMK